ncbi:MAG: membrane protein insertase YidC, partial [Nitrospinales bacterium]
MDFDKKTILAFLLIAVVYLIWTSDFYQKRFGPPQRPNQETSAETQTQPLPNEQQEPEKAQTRSVEKPAPITRAVESSQENELPEQSRYAHLRGDGEEINVETDRYKAVFSSSGATLKSWELKEYFLEDGRPVEIIKNQRLKNLGVLLPTSIDTINTAELVFSSNKQSISLNGTRETEKLEFVLELDEYQKLKKTYIFYRDRYDFSLEIELINMNGLIEGY